MSEGDVRQENTYWSREMADLLKIGDSTLRKWCRVFEAQGYRFIRDDQERRAFTDHDALALRYFKELTQDKGVSLDSAAKAVAERFNRGAVQSISPSATKLPERYDSAMQQILDHMKRQEEFNNRLLQELADQRRYIDESLNRRDEQLMRFLRESREARKELAAAKSKRKWWQLWLSRDKE